MSFIGVLPQANSCMRMLDANMQQCYTKAGLSPSMFGSNETEIKGAIIGKDKEAASRFCGWVTSICQDGIKINFVW